MATLIKLGKPKLSPKVQEYRDKFGHLPSAEAMKWKTTEDLEIMAQVALMQNRPIKDWAERPNRVTGTVTDGWYAKKRSPESNE